MDEREVGRAIQDVYRVINESTSALAGVMALLIELRATADLDRDKVKAIAAEIARAQHGMGTVGTRQANSVIDTVINGAIARKQAAPQG